jgi:4-oxalocrotonate tautomerase
MARRITDVITDLTKLPKEAIWVVFEDVKATDWYVGDKSVHKLKGGS